MLPWWRRLLGRRPPLIRPAAAARPRTYSADSGYVYQYVYAGFRHFRAASGAVHEYAFDIATGRAPAFTTSVILHEAPLRATLARSRELTASERYGVAKVALKRALDSFEHPAAVPAEIVPGEEELAAIGEILDL